MCHAAFIVASAGKFAVFCAFPLIGKVASKLAGIADSRLGRPLALARREYRQAVAGISPVGRSARLAGRSIRYYRRQRALGPKSKAPAPLDLIDKVPRDT
jgi:hypothetical protein